jgi:ribosomal-protein-serine acetyltransferase
LFVYGVDEEITLKLLDLNDARELFHLTDRSRGYLREWLPWVDDTRTVLDSENFIRHDWQAFEERLGLRLGIIYRGRLAGMIAFNYFDWPNRTGVIGYWQGVDFQGRGIMTRATSALIDYGFRQLGLNRIEIRAAMENVKSRKIPERLGFTIEGQVRQGEWLYDHFVDLVIYGMLANEWGTARFNR